MRTHGFSTKRLLVAFCLCTVIGGMIFTCGCTQSPATPPATTVVTTAAPTTVMATPTQEVVMSPEEMTSYNESANGSTVNTTIGEEFLISLRENPTTGYMWNATVTSGLTILNDTYTMDAAPEGMVGVGGTRSWLLTGTEAGMQKFEAVSMRPWENVTGSEDSFVLNVNVVNA